MCYELLASYLVSAAVLESQLQLVNNGPQLALVAAAPITTDEMLAHRMFRRQSVTDVVWSGERGADKGWLEEYIMRRRRGESSITCD